MVSRSERIACIVITANAFDIQKEQVVLHNCRGYERISYPLSAAQISDNIFEVIDREGIIIDEKRAEEAWKFWNELRAEPFGVLVNCENSFSISFEGAQEIAKHPLQRKRAVIVDNFRQEQQIKTTMKIKEVLGHHDFS